MRLLENSLAKGVITAPYSGRVLSLAARPGMIVTGADAGREGNTLLELADLTRLRVEAAINEIDVAVLTPDMSVEITFESVPEAKAAGRITFIAPAAGKAAGGKLPSGRSGRQLRRFQGFSAPDRHRAFPSARASRYDRASSHRHRHFDTDSLCAAYVGF